MERRQFVKKSLRYTAALGLVAMGAYVITSRKDDSQACDFDFICQNCRKKQKCQLPEALAHKNQQQEVKK